MTTTRILQSHPLFDPVILKKVEEAVLKLKVKQDKERKQKTGKRSSSHK